MSELNLKLISRARLARALGVDTDTVSKILTKREMPNAYLAFRMAETLGIEVGDLIAELARDTKCRRVMEMKSRYNAAMAAWDKEREERES